MIVEIFYIVSVRISGEIILEVRKVRPYAPDRNKGNFVFFVKNIPFKAISVKVTPIVTDSQSIYDVASVDGIKRRLVA